MPSDPKGLSDLRTDLSPAGYCFPSCEAVNPRNSPPWHCLLSGLSFPSSFQGAETMAGRGSPLHRESISTHGVISTLGAGGGTRHSPWGSPKWPKWRGEKCEWGPCRERTASLGVRCRGLVLTISGFHPRGRL